jgi:hypothetical protein
MLDNTITKIDMTYEIIIWKYLSEVSYIVHGMIETYILVFILANMFMQANKSISYVFEVYVIIHKLYLSKFQKNSMYGLAHT